jgi:hypothetical protein
MKTFYLSVLLLLTPIIIFLLTSCKNREVVKEQQPTNKPDTANKVKESKLEENPYTGLRNLAFSTTPEDLKLKLDENKSIVYGIIMDWDIGQALATITSFKTGDASLYLSTGQTYMGGYGHENVRNAALDFVNKGQDYLSKSILTLETTLPDKNFVKFYLLSNKGKYMIQDLVDKITSQKSDLTPLFDLGNKVITEYRKAIDDK